MKKLPPILSSDSENHPKTMLRNTSILALLLALAVSSAWATGPYQNELRARVTANGQFVELPKPLYFADFYPGAWNLSLQPAPFNTPDGGFWYKPVNQPGNSFHIGNYSQANYGSYTTVKKRLKIQKDYGIYPAIQIMERHHIAYNNGKWSLVDWNDMGVVKSGFSGASDNGAVYYGANVYDKVYKPVLDELKLPHIVQIDMWQFESEAHRMYGSDNTLGNPVIPVDTFKRLWWEEFTWQIKRIFPNGTINPSNYLVKFKGYGKDMWLPGVAIYGDVAWSDPYPNQCLTNGVDSLAIQFLKATSYDGNPYNPYTGEYIPINFMFWMHFNGTVNPNFTTCPNMPTSAFQTDVNHVNVRADALPKSTIWGDYFGAEGWFDDALPKTGPRYFYGFFPRFKSGRVIYQQNSLNCLPNPPIPCRDYTLYNTTVGEQFLRDPNSAGKGMVFIAHGDLAESGFVEPVMPAGSPQDPVNPWVNGRPAQLDWFWNKKIPVTLPWQLQ